MIKPMLSKPTENLPGGKGYIYEIKLDGQRTIAELRENGLLLYTRNFQKVTDKYPEVHELTKCIHASSAIVDGEIVALKEGIPNFELLQQRMSLRNLRMLPRLLEKIPVLYYLFDIIELDGKSLLRVPLIERKKILQRTIKPGRSVKILPFFESKQVTLKNALSFGYEGVVAKRADSFYYPGQRTDCWFKQKFQQTDSFVVGGWLDGGRSKNFGSLLIGQYIGKKLVYAGRVGTGFNEKSIEKLMKEFERLASPVSPFAPVPTLPKGRHWLKPKLVAEIKFKEWTEARILRAPVFMGLRPDLSPSDCRSSAEPV
jgi:bifunctional non-homologous end joining protein LigD